MLKDVALGNWGRCQGNNSFMSVSRSKTNLWFEFKMSDSDGETSEKQVKIVLVGDGTAGKVKD